MKKLIISIVFLGAVTFSHQGYAKSSLFCPHLKVIEKVIANKKDTSEPIPFTYENYKAVLNLQGNTLDSEMKLLRVVLHRGTGVVWCYYGKTFQAPPLESEIGVEIKLENESCFLKETETDYEEDTLISEIDLSKGEPKEVEIVCRSGAE